MQLKQTFPSWTFIKSLFEKKLARISYAVLVIVPIAITIIEQINKKTDLQIKMPNTLGLVFASALAFGIAWLIYISLAPSIIKKYTDYSNYNNYVKQIKKEAAPDSMPNIVLAHLMDSQKEAKERITHLFQLIDGETNQNKIEELRRRIKTECEPLFDGCVTRHSQKEWIIENTAKWFARWAALVFCFIGLSIVAYLFVHRINVVFKHYL